jgi:RecA/RadA recombinase
MIRPILPTDASSGDPRRSPESLATALTRLEARWGSAAIRLGNGSVFAARPANREGSPPASFPVEGALAPLPSPAPPPPDPLAPLDDRVVPTGFPALDAILGPGGLVREAQVTLRGEGSCGKTTLALRLVAEAQARGAIVAWLDLGRAFDPLEAVGRGVDLAWLLVLRTPDSIEGLRLAGALLGGRAVEVLVADLPERMPVDREELLRRLAARARQVGARLVTLEPASLASSLRGALAESAGVGLDLQRRAWIRAGRDVVGQRTEVTVEKNRFGPPGRRVELEIRYLDEGDRDRGVERLLDTPPPPRSASPPAPSDPSPERTIAVSTHATPPSRLAPPAPPARAHGAPASRAGRPGRSSLGPRTGARLQPLGAPARRAPGDDPRGGPRARP